MKFVKKYIKCPICNTENNGDIIICPVCYHFITQDEKRQHSYQRIELSEITQEQVDKATTEELLTKVNNRELAIHLYRRGFLIKDEDVLLHYFDDVDPLIEKYIKRGIFFKEMLQPKVASYCIEDDTYPEGIIDAHYYFPTQIPVSILCAERGIYVLDREIMALKDNLNRNTLFVILSYYRNEKIPEDIIQFINEHPDLLLEPNRGCTFLNDDFDSDNFFIIYDEYEAYVNMYPYDWIFLNEYIDPIRVCSTEVKKCIKENITKRLKKKVVVEYLGRYDEYKIYDYVILYKKRPLKKKIRYFLEEEI